MIHWKLLLLVHQCAQNGILIRNRLALEEARQIDTVIFDKTAQSVGSIWCSRCHAGHRQLDTGENLGIVSSEADMNIQSQ
jgi:hypothetical protein